MVEAAAPSTGDLVIPTPPSCVWVGSLEFPIHVVPEGHAMLGKKLNGLCCWGDAKQGIYVGSFLPPRTLLDVFLHELTHAVNHVADITDGVDEETIADQHGHIWSQVWLDNPQLIGWVFDMTVYIREAQRNA